MKLLKIPYYIFIALITTIALLLLISVFPITGNIKFMTVLSGSMEPGIKTGGVVVVKPMNEYGIGDIITFGPNTKTRPPTTHRIVEQREENGITVFVTKGDANESIDIKTVRKNEIIGKVIFDIPYLGYGVAAAQKPYGFIFIIVIPALLIIIDESQKIWKEIKKRKEPEKPEE